MATAAFLTFLEISENETIVLCMFSCTSYRRIFPVLSYIFVDRVIFRFSKESSSGTDKDDAHSAKPPDSKNIAIINSFIKILNKLLPPTPLLFFLDILNIITQ